MTNLVETEPIQYEVDGHVARIWLNRPHKRNSVSQQLLQELDEARIRAENDPEVRVIVIRGREGTFCSGFDLDELQGDFIGSSAAYEIAQRSARICDSIFRSPKPSVAVLEGYTTAGGFEIMINCDFAIATEDAKIGDFHMRRALFGGAGPIYRLPRILGERKAKELMLTGKLLTSGGS
jgi:enoyl-CoA hydratase